MSIQQNSSIDKQKQEHIIILIAVQDDCPCPILDVEADADRIEGTYHLQDCFFNGRPYYTMEETNSTVYLFYYETMGWIFMTSRLDGPIVTLDIDVESPLLTDGDWHKNGTGITVNMTCSCSAGKMDY